MTSLFCQAEDGIRAIGVTGVQTCALPISDGKIERAAHEVAAAARDNLFTVTQSRRSEERRVGKECRSPRTTNKGSKKTRNRGVLRTERPPSARTMNDLR